jgi:hypothetical protein
MRARPALRGTNSATDEPRRKGIARGETGWYSQVKLKALSLRQAEAYVRPCGPAREAAVREPAVLSNPEPIKAKKV